MFCFHIRQGAVAKAFIRGFGRRLKPVVGILIFQRTRFALVARAWIHTNFGNWAGKSADSVLSVIFCFVIRSMRKICTV